MIMVNMLGHQCHGVGYICQELEYLVRHVNYIAQNGVGVVEGVCKNLNLMPY